MSVLPLMQAAVGTVFAALCAVILHDGYADSGKYTGNSNEGDDARVDGLVCEYRHK